MPGPQFKGVDDKGSANHAYYVWVDLYNTLGLGANVPIASANGGESLLALVDGKFVDIRIPYPLGFFSKNVDGRIDDANAGWKGRGCGPPRARAPISTAKAARACSRKSSRCRCDPIRSPIDCSRGFLTMPAPISI